MRRERLPDAHWPADGMSGAGLSARDVRPGCVATRSGAACAEQHILCSRTSGVCNGETTACSLACCEDKENSTEMLNTKQQLRPAPCSRHRCRARRLHLKQQTRRCESALVRLIMHSWRTCAKNLAARRAKLERCLATSVETLERTRLRKWQENVQQAWLQASRAAPPPVRPLGSSAGWLTCERFEAERGLTQKSQYQPFGAARYSSVVPPIPRAPARCEADPTLHSSAPIKAPPRCSRLGGWQVARGPSGSSARRPGRPARASHPPCSRHRSNSRVQTAPPLTPPRLTTASRHGGCKWCRQKPWTREKACQPGCSPPPKPSFIPIARRPHSRPWRAREGGPSKMPCSSRGRRGFMQRGLHGRTHLLAARLVLSRGS